MGRNCLRRHWHPTLVVATSRWTSVGWAIGALTLGATSALAQQPTVSTAVASGVVYDSIARRVMAGATVEFVNANNPSARPLTTVSDSAGRYTLREVPFGSYLAGFYHPALDTLGLESAPRRIDVDQPTEHVDLARPSARTVRASLCRGELHGDSTGLLIGHVRMTDGQGPVSGATVVVEWSETVVNAEGISDRTRRVTGQSAEPGWFAICGLPSDIVLQARAFAAVDSSGFVEIDVPANALRHVSFFLGGASLVAPSPTDSIPGDVATSETAWRGRARLTGTVTDAAGKPVVDAHAVVWGTKLDAVTNERGAFTLTDLPGGTQTLEVRAVGFVPVITTVHLAESRPAMASVVLAKRAEVLSTVEVRGEREHTSNLADFNRRRRVGFGQVRTSEQIARRGKNTKLSQLLQDFMGITVQTRNGQSIVTMQRNATTVTDVSRMRVPCRPSLYVDGRIDRMADFDIYFSDEIDAIEVYRENSRPVEFIDPSNACGAVAITTRVAPRPPTK
jgi:hypothetical protein